MEYIGALIIAVVGSSGVASIAVAMLHRKWEKEDKKNATKKDLEPINNVLAILTKNQKVLAIDRIRHLVKIHIAAGEVSLEDKENIHEMYDSYKELGGNGHLDTVMDELDKLPIKK